MPQTDSVDHVHRALRCRLPASLRQYVAAVVLCGFGPLAVQAQSGAGVSNPLPAVRASGGQLPSLGDNSALAAAAERRLGDRIAREIYRDPDYLVDAVLLV